MSRHLRLLRFCVISPLVNPPRIEHVPNTGDLKVTNRILASTLANMAITGRRMWLMNEGSPTKGSDLIDLLLKDKLVHEIAITEVTPCLSDSERIKFLARTDRPLNEVLEILYLYIPGSNYSEALGSLTYKRQRRMVTLFSTGKISMTYVKDKDEAKKLLQELKDLINRAFAYSTSHGKPESDLLESRKKVGLVEIYNSLPKTNCKECDEPSCYVFAIKLMSGEKELDNCTQLRLPQYVDKLATLSRMIQPIRL